jgi:hypothetical protein
MQDYIGSRSYTKKITLAILSNYKSPVTAQITLAEKKLQMLENMMLIGH